MSLSLLKLNEPGAVVAAASAYTAHIIGGGTLLVRRANMGDVGIEHYVRFEDEAACRIMITSDVVVLGARTTMAAILRHPGLTFLAAAAKSVGSPAVREMATVAGNLHAPSPYGDFATLLLALDALVTLHDGERSLELPLDAFLGERDARWQSSLVTSVKVRQPLADDRVLFRKIGRSRDKGVSVLTIAVRLALSGEKIIDARIAFGAVCDRPVRSIGSEAALVGMAWTPDGIAAALAVACQGLTLRDDAVASAWYRREVLPIHLARLLSNSKDIVA